jgi:hypothetical protein
MKELTLPNHFQSPVGQIICAQGGRRPGERLDSVTQIVTILTTLMQQLLTPVE